MQPSNHTESSATRYTPFPAQELQPESAATKLDRGPERDTEDYPEIAEDRATKKSVATRDPVVSQSPAVETAENEATLWDGRTSGKVFIVRLLIGTVLSLGWTALAVTTWGFGYANLAILTWILLAAVLLFWAFTGITVFRAIHSHHYRLTDRRLFVRSGLFRRRIDQIELLRVKDVFVQQNLLGNWIGVGHVVVVSSEQTLPRAILYGIDRPRHVMDLIWLRTRAELDNKTSRESSKFECQTNSIRRQARVDVLDPGQDASREVLQPREPGGLDATPIALALRTPLLQWTTIRAPGPARRGGRAARATGSPSSRRSGRWRSPRGCARPG